MRDASGHHQSRVLHFRRFGQGRRFGQSQRLEGRRIDLFALSLSTHASHISERAKGSGDPLIEPQCTLTKRGDIATVLRNKNQRSIGTQHPKAVTKQRAGALVGPHNHLVEDEHIGPSGKRRGKSERQHIAGVEHAHRPVHVARDAGCRGNGRHQHVLVLTEVHATDFLEPGNDVDARRVGAHKSRTEAQH